MSRYLLLVFAFVLALSGSAAASERFGGIAGVGTSFARNEQGWLVRVEGRNDAREVDEDDEFVIGNRLGFDLWNAGGHTGFAMPIGFFVGGQTDLARATLGGGLGLWAFDVGGSGGTAGGVAPFVSSAVDFQFGKVLVSIEARMSRQIVDHDDYNLYSVVMLLGRRSR